MKPSIIQTRTIKPTKCHWIFTDAKVSRSWICSNQHCQLQKLVCLFLVRCPDAWKLNFVLEKASVDESFIDFTRPVQTALLERYPELATPPPNSALGLDTPLPPPPEAIEWNTSCNLVPVTPEDDTEDTTGEKLDTEQDAPATWHDVALSIATDLMFQARDQIRKTLGYTTSAVRIKRYVQLHLIIISRASLAISS